MVLFMDFLPGLDLFEVTLFLVEFFPYVVAANILLIPFVKRQFIPFFICFLPLFILAAVAVTVITSYEYAMKEGYDLSKPSIRTALEHYIETGEGDLEDIIESNTYPPVFGKFEVSYLMRDLMRHTFLHSDDHNNELIPVSYNKGNDWFEATLGKSMQYSGGLYKTGDESVVEAQLYKLDFMANSIGLKEGEQVLDVGCGWSQAVQRFTNKYKADVTGVTLSSDQYKYFNDKIKPTLRKGSKTKVLLQDAMTLRENPEIKGKKFDKVVSVEMMEHVGIRRYQQFLASIQDVMADDGVFYVQVAGLRRGWKFIDFVWGLFMGEHIFPGADASCPIGWVTTQLERGGFEVQRVHNTGTHYSKIIDGWLKEWRGKKDLIVKEYGIKAYRRWEVFLRWSVTIAREGSSTVFMIAATKQQQTTARIDAQKRLVPVW